MGAKIYNSNLTKEIIDGAKLQVQDGNIPSEIGNTVVPVMEVNPKLLRETNFLASGAVTNSTGSTIATTSTTKDTYLTGCQVSFVKDAGSTATLIRAYCTRYGTTTPEACVRIACLTGVAQAGETSVTFANPIKLARGSNLTINPDTNVANLSTAVVFHGYTIDNIQWVTHSVNSGRTTRGTNGQISKNLVYS